MQQQQQTTANSTRVISYSEVSKALDCQASWDFAYGGHLAGDALKPKAVAPRLSGGRAWGAAVAALHAEGPAEAMVALVTSLEADAERMRGLGVYVKQDHDGLLEDLGAILDHYAVTAELFPVEALEHELLVPIPSRTGRGLSSRYRLLCYLDAVRPAGSSPGLTGDWLVEYKLRGRLTDVWQITLSRQIRWYAWAWRQLTGRQPAGVQVVERLNQVPKPPRIVNAKRKGEGIDGKTVSHAKDQLCTVEDYQDACQEYGVEPEPDTVEALRLRRWHQTVPVQFREGELDEAGRELASAGKLIHQLDSAELMPLRNVKAAHCNGCDFKDICPAPDSDLVDALFERRPAKRFLPDPTTKEDGHDADPAAAATATVNF